MASVVPLPVVNPNCSSAISGAKKYCSLNRSISIVKLLMQSLKLVYASVKLVPLMTSSLVTLVILLSCAASTCLEDTDPRMKPYSKIRLDDYCGCFHAFGVSGSINAAKCCFKDFFKSLPVLKNAVKRFRNREDCATGVKENTIDVLDCKIARLFDLSVKFRKDMRRLVEKEGTAIPSHSMYQYWLYNPHINEACNQRLDEYGERNRLRSQKFRTDIGNLSAKSFEQFVKGNVAKVKKLAVELGKSSIGPEMKKQVQMLCYDEYKYDSDKEPSGLRKFIFCELQSLIRFMKKMRKLTKEAKKASKWTTEQLRTFHSALRIDLFVHIEYYYGAFYSDKPKKVKDYERTINTIVELVKAGNFDQLKMLIKFLPSDILTCAGSHMTTTEDCYFKQILDQLVTHFKFSDVQNNGRKRIMLSTATNYEKLLQFRQMDRILVVVQENQLTSVALAKDITNSNNQRFVELRNYFVQLQSFNQNKAKADIEFIEGWIRKYKTSANQLAKDVGGGLMRLLKGAVHSTIAEVAGKAAAMALAVAEACNPLKTIFGGSSAGDILSAAEELGVAMGKMSTALSLRGKLDTLINKATDLAMRFGKNSDELKRVMELVKSYETSDSVKLEMQKKLFMEKYSAYSPEVKRPELAEVESYWNEVVTEACDIINGLETLAATTVSFLEVKDHGTCVKLPVKIAEMMATYTEIYDFQFDLMETLASSMRAKIGKRAAQYIASNFKSMPLRKNDNTKRYRNIYTLSYLTYNFQTWNTIETYCDKLQYAEGGVRPRECQGKRTKLPSLMSRTKRICTGDNHQVVRIPIKPTGKGDRAFLNLTKLYKGEDVSFKIGNKQWLVDYNWIMANEAKEAIYVKDLEVFLPTVTKDSMTYISKSMAVGENVLNPCEECPAFILPNVERKSKFKEGYEASCSKRRQFRNPYTICKSNPLPVECRITERTEKAAGNLYPSIFALWKIKIDGYQHTPIPEPANQDMFIKAKITYCSLAISSKKSSTAFTRGRKSRKCCEGRNYFSSDANQCTECPKGSEPNLHGYYCEKNKDAIMVE
eukprot:gene2995-3453_t